MAPILPMTSSFMWCMLLIGLSSERWNFLVVGYNGHGLSRKPHSSASIAFRQALSFFGILGSDIGYVEGRPRTTCHTQSIQDGPMIPAKASSNTCQGRCSETALHSQETSPNTPRMDQRGGGCSNRSMENYNPPPPNPPFTFPLPPPLSIPLL